MLDVLLYSRRHHCYNILKVNKDLPCLVVVVRIFSEAVRNWTSKHQHRSISEVDLPRQTGETEMDDKVITESKGPYGLITEEHVKEALKEDRGPGAQMISWKIKDFTKKGDNFVSFVTSVSVVFREKGKTQSVSYIAKLNPCHNIKDFESFAERAYNKEALFYRDLLPELNTVLMSIGQPSLNFPKCFHFNLEKGKEFFLLEDLRRKGYKMTGMGFSGIDVAHTNLILREMARLHSASWLLQQRRPNEEVKDKYSFLKEEIFDPSYSGGQHINRIMKKGISITTDILEHVGGYEKILKWMEKNAVAIDLLQKMVQSSPPFDVVCHGDAHANNALFRYNDLGEPEEVMLLDLQINRFASLATDINYLLFLNLEGEVRKTNLNSFLETYFTSFDDIATKSGRKTPFTFQELKREFHSKHKFALAVFMSACQLFVSQDHEMPDPADFFGVPTPDTTAEAKVKYLESFEKNDQLRKKFLAVFDEMNMEGVFDD
ncbi:hypothetical protein SK128_004889 [Halocaridina rubra]|uniref:CHK kinase-like domain-containing protein n=1 Tax=Halocaridina rubra TaxID=373956 RepID=A0AAN9AB85_HALRR